MRKMKIDPVTSVMKFAYQMAADHGLDNIEAALEAAAFALFGPDDHASIAREAVYYHAQYSGRPMSALREARHRRAEAGTVGTMAATL
jgi:hypothetical protein